MKPGETKQITIHLKRNPNIPLPSAIYATQFAIRDEAKTPGIFELLFTPGIGSLSTHSIVLDASFLKENSAPFVKYLAALAGDPDDESQNPKIPYVAQQFYANGFQLSQSAGRAETMFSLTAIHDFANIRKATLADEETILADPVLLVYSGIGLQKKLVSELLTLIKAPE